MNEHDKGLFEEILKKNEFGKQAFDDAQLASINGDWSNISPAEEDEILERMFLTHYVKEYLQLKEEKDTRLKRMVSSDYIDAPTNQDIQLTSYYMGYQYKEVDLLGDGSLIPCFYDGDELLGTVIEVNLKPTSNLEHANLFLEILKKNGRFTKLDMFCQSNGKWGGSLQVKGRLVQNLDVESLLELIVYFLGMFHLHFSRVPIK